MPGDILHLAQTHDAGGAAHAGDHSAGADLQGFISRQRRGHVEDDLTGFQLDLEFPPGFLDGDGGAPVQSDGLVVVQADIGGAVVAGFDAVSAVELHAFKEFQGDAAGILDGDAALHQLHAHGDRLGCGGGSGHGQPQEQEQGQQECQEFSHSGFLHL